jgi:hypothetical protein
LIHSYSDERADTLVSEALEAFRIGAVIAPASVEGLVWINARSLMLDNAVHIREYAHEQREMPTRRHFPLLMCSAKRARCLPRNRTISYSPPTRHDREGGMEA